MQIKSVTDTSFKKYGKIVTGFDFSELLETLENTTEKPIGRTVYVPGDKQLERLPIMQQLWDNVYGGMPIQIGYCNGENTRLNCLEYHRSCEVNIAADDVVLLLAQMSDIYSNYMLDTAKVEAFSLPKGTAALLYETSLHYAPARKSGGFRVAIVLPQDTNTEKPAIDAKNGEDQLLWARNKWLLAHPSSDEAKQGAHIGLSGKNIDLSL
ncbi:MAG: DUF4867 family protein [Christensenellaceae bacterium]|jgi:hypothetical protein